MIHLLIMNGPEQRNFMLERTIQLCKPYFDSIRILQNGGTSSSDLIEEYTIGWESSFCGYIEGLNKLKEGIPNGDWIFLLDSDERPQQTTLDFIKSATTGQFLAHSNTIAFPFRHHAISDEGKIYRICGHETGFVACRMFRIEDGLSAKVHASAHFAYVQQNPSILQSTHFINHFKHDFATKLSTLSYGLAYPDSIGVTPEMWEFDVLNRVKNMFEIVGQFCPNYSVKLTPSSPYEYYYDCRFWHSVSLITDRLFSSQHQPCRDIAQIIVFMFSDTRSLDELYRHQKCGQSCCEYTVQY